jgi:hypothetical protein
MDGAMTGMSSMLKGLELSDVSSGLSAFSQIGGGVASFAQGKKNAKMLKELGVISAREERVRTARLLGAQQTAAAASGIDPTSGSALDVQAETALEGEIAALMAQFDYDSQAEVARNEGTQALIGGFQNAAGTILGGQLAKLGQNPRTPTPTSYKAPARNFNAADYSGYA